MGLTKFLKILIAGLALWFIGHIAYITFDGLKANNSKADVAVILGSKVNEDGTPVVPSVPQDNSELTNETECSTPLSPVLRMFRRPTSKFK